MPRVVRIREVPGECFFGGVSTRMQNIGLVVVAVGCLAASSAQAVTAISRFESGLEGWTLEGAGQLEWITSGGSPGGYIRVTRTGPGEVYLVAPASFHQSACTGVDASCIVCLSVTADRPIARSLWYEVQTSRGVMTEQPGIGCQGCWFPAARDVYLSGPGSGALDYQGLRIRVGVDPALPIGEVMLFDNIEFRSAIANCDGSTGTPFLNINDFQCFINAYAARDPYGNIDGSTAPPVFNANDFQAFIGRYAAAFGCP